MKTIIGNLITLGKENHFDIIVHGCNCFNQMGKGLAKYIHESFPEAYEADCKTERGDKNKLGTYSMAIVDDLTVINAYTQYKYRGKNNIDYDAIRDVFKQIAEDFPGKSIGIPRIGAGLAGGDWNKIERIITEVMVDADITLVLL